MKIQKKDIETGDLITGVSSSEELLVVDFAKWCVPCRMDSLIIEKLTEYEGKVKFLKVDIDQNVNLAKEFNTLTIPTPMLTHSWMVTPKIIGVQATATYRGRINVALRRN